MGERAGLAAGAPVPAVGRVLGVGVDMVTISELERYVPAGAGGGVAPGEDELDAFVRRAFTPAERAQAWGRARPTEFLAGRFAVKEAVFKAVAPLTRDGFDLRKVESLDGSDGAPRVTLAGPLALVFAEAGVRDVLVSVSNEGDLAVAFAVAQG